MPYDSRPWSEGGNRGIDDRFSREAPEGKFRLVGVDTFDGGDWVIGDYDTLAQAQEIAEQKTKATQMLMCHIYDDKGDHLIKRGKF